MKNYVTGPLCLGSWILENLSKLGASKYPGNYPFVQENTAEVRRISGKQCRGWYEFFAEMNFTWRVSGCGVIGRWLIWESERHKNIKECIVVVTNPFSFIQLCLATASLKSPGRENPSIRIWEAKCVPCLLHFKVLYARYFKQPQLSNLFYSIATYFI